MLYLLGLYPIAMRQPALARYEGLQIWPFKSKRIWSLALSGTE